MQEKKKISRRKAVKVLGAGAVTAVSLGGQTVVAQGQRSANEIEQYLRKFDPSDPDEVKKAVGHLLLIDTRDEAEEILMDLPPKRRDALIQAIKDSVGLTLETGEEELDQVPDGSPDGVSTTATSRTYHCKGVLKNATFGTTEGVFDHYVHWEYGGSTVDNFSHWKKVRTPGWLTYWNGMTTDYIDNREDYGVSKMGGNFEACVTNYGCYLSETVGSGIWVYPNGDVACNPWDDSHTNG